MKKLPIIYNKKCKNKNRITNSLQSYHLKPITYYKYEDLPSNLSQIIFNDQSISQSTFPTNLKNVNSSLIPIDHRYYSTINITKKLPLSRNLNVTSTYLSKNNSFYNNRSSPEIEKYLDKKSIIYNYISKNYKIEKEQKNNKSENFKINKEIIVDAEKMKMNTHLIKMKQKMKKTKFKLYKIIINNRKQTCGLFEKKNDIFNGKLHNYLKSSSFYEKNKKFHRVFHFGKNDLNLGHDFTKHYVEPYNQQKYPKLTSKYVLKLLNEEDIDLIHSDPFFFLKDNKYLYKLTNTKYRSLPYILREEERLKENNNNLDEDEDETEDKKEKKNNNNSNNSLNKSKGVKKEHQKKNLKKIVIKKKMKKSQTADDIKFIYDGVLFYNKKYIDKIINDDLNKRLKENSKKKNGEIEKEMRDNIIKLNNYKKKDYIFESNNNFYKTFNEKTSSNYFKPYSLRKNSERLLQEIHFQEKRNEKYYKDNAELSTISKYKKMLENIYKKNNNKEEEK